MPPMLLNVNLHILAVGEVLGTQGTRLGKRLLSTSAEP